MIKVLFRIFLSFILLSFAYFAKSQTSISVPAGWTLLGNGSSGAINVSETFSNSTAITTVWTWSTNEQKWSFYTPSLSDGGQSYALNKRYNPLLTINNNQGFWINAAKPFNVNINSNGIWSISQINSGSSTTTQTTTTTTTTVATTTSTTTGTPAIIPIALQKTSYLNAKNVGLSRINFPDSLRTVTPDQPTGWGAGDFFKNGTLDIFTTKQNYSTDTLKYPPKSVISDGQYKSDFQFWRKDANGNLTLLLTYKGCLHPRKALVNDFNQDGYPDVFVSCTGYDGPIDGKILGEKSKLLLNDGNGGFLISDATDVGYYHGATSADVNGDGYPDIVVADILNIQKPGSQGSALHTLINQKNGTFADDQTRILNFIPFANYWSVELIDIDGDGILDLIAGGDENANWKPAATTIFYGNSSGIFGASTTAIPKVAGRGTILDFSLVTNGSKKTLYIGRTADNTDGQPWYSTKTLQAFDLTTNTATVIFDKLNTMWEAWWLPTTRNNQKGVSSYTGYQEDVFFYQ